MLIVFKWLFGVCAFCPLQFYYVRWSEAKWKFMEIGQRYKSIRTNTIAVSADLNHLADMGGIVGARHLPTCKPMCLSKWEKTNPLNFFYIICGTWRDAELRNCALYNILHNIWKRRPSSKEMWWWWWVGWQGVVIVRKCCSCCPGHFNFIRDYKVWWALLS